MSDFVISKEKGIGYFKSLQEEFSTPNLVTYDNDMWGNMNPYFAKDDKEKEDILRKDREVMNLLGVSKVLAMTIPLDNTFLEINNRVLSSLFFQNESTSVPVHANAVIISESLDTNTGVVVSPRDCAVVVLKSKESNISVIVHIGAPQIFQGLHEHIMLYLSALLGRKDLSDYVVYIYPHISQRNYKLSEEKLELLSAEMGKYLDSNKGFDFIGLFKEYISENYRITNIVDSEGIDSYESAKSGNMYSYTYAKEVGEQDPSVIGAHNVALKI